MKIIRAADLFCGAGGSSTGLVRACESVGRRLDLLAINHWDCAIETHSANHGKARHLCETLDSVDPRKVMRGQLDLLIASPECTHHSNARGGKPCSDQSRASAWHVTRWAEALMPRAILVENVREFVSWGPLGENARPLKRRRGETFRAWLDAIRSLGYTVEYRILNAADYGDATTRERLFVLAVRGKGPVPWPDPTHSKSGAETLFGVRSKWRAAREIIDWTIPGKSIFGRKHPLKPNTLKRIEAGLRKFCGLAFSVSLTHQGSDRVHDLDAPLPTVTGANRGELGLVEPFVVQLNGTAPDQIPSTAKSIDEPLGTVTGCGHFGIAEPFVMSAGGCEVGPRSVDDPLNTVLTRDHMPLVEPFILPPEGYFRGNAPRSLDAPLQTITSRGGGVLVEPFIVKYNSTGGAYPISDPLDTISTKDRFGLVTVDGRLIDIRFRMLQPHELAAAMGFPSGYHFAGKRKFQVKQIGNAVAVNLAQRLCEAILRAA